MYLGNLTATEETSRSLWKARKRIKLTQEPIPPIKIQDGKWARDETQEAETFPKGPFSPFH